MYLLGQPNLCQKFEVIGGSSETAGIYELTDDIAYTSDNLVWKKPEEDRLIFNTGNAFGWRIGTRRHFKTGRGHYMSK